MSDTAIKGLGPANAEDQAQTSTGDTTASASVLTQSAALSDAIPDVAMQEALPSEAPPASIQAILQEADTKASQAITPVPPSIPPRPEVSRSVSDSVNGRLPHILPSRPEAPSSKTMEHRMPERPNDQGFRDPGRDSRFPERGRMDRPGDVLRDRLPERHVSGPYPRSYERPNERPNIGDRGRVDPAWRVENDLPGRPGYDNGHGPPHNRDVRPSSHDRPERPHRDRQYPEELQGAGIPDTQGQSTRDSPMAPPRSTIPQHPDRVALIHGNQDLDRMSSNNHHSDRRPERYERNAGSGRSSRGPSPARIDDRRQTRQDAHRDGRPPLDGRRGAEDMPLSNSSRYDESHLPTGPRTDRPSGVSQSDRFRDSNRITSTAAPTIDSNHGRLNQESSHNSRQSEQYGRLNPGPDVSSTSRMSNGNHAPSIRGASRIVSAPQPPVTSQNVALSMSASEKQAPTGPASNRGPPRNSAPSSRTDYAPLSAPPTPVTEVPDTAGIHPDRLKAIQGPGSAPPNGNASNQNASRPPRPSLPPVAVPVPTGPRGTNSQLTSPMAPSPANRGPPPTGPAFANERNRGDKRFAGLQTMLQQAGTPNGVERSGQGASIRGRGGRANHGMASASHSGPPTPSVAKPDPFPPSRADLFAGRPNGPPTPQHAEDNSDYGRGGWRDTGHGHPREGERRSERHRANHSPGRDGASGPSMPPREEERRPRRENLRERPRGPEPPNERDMRRPARDEQAHDWRGGPDRRDVEGWGASERHGGPPDRRDERDRRDGGSMGRKRGRGGEEAPFDRSHGDNKRPRRAQQ